MGSPSVAAGTRSQDVYDRLRNAILRGELRPNEPLIEADLAVQLQVSRTPIREGLQRLAADGLIVSRRRGWSVRDHSRDEVRQIYEVRAALEGYAARLAAERASNEQLTSLRRMAAATARKHDGNHQELVVLNDEFHDALIAVAGNDLLADLIRRSCQYHFNYGIAALYSAREAAAAVTGHRRLARALLERDADEAERVAREHVAEALGVLLRKLR